MERSLLLVDDDPDYRFMVRRALGSIGEFAIVEASDGLEALQRYHDSEARFDVVLSDTHMPKMTGPVLRAELASRGFQGRFLLMSGLASTTVGVDIVKPLLPAVLRASLAVHLRDKEPSPTVS